MDEIQCWRCGVVIPDAELTELEALVWPPGTTEFRMPEPPGVRTRAGTLWTAGDAHYCSGCAPDVAVCRGCGCTDENACEFGCWWVERDLCSACAASSAGARPGE